MNAHGPGQFFIECDGQKIIVQDDHCCQDGQKNDEGKKDFRSGHGQNVAEQIAEKIKVVSAGDTGQDNACSNTEGRNDSDGRVALNPF